MKKTRLDLSILENADEKTMNAVGGENIPLSDKDKERLFKMSIQKADGNYTPEGEVSGVEITHRRSFMPAIASAAAVLVLAGAGGGLVYTSRNNSASDGNAEDNALPYAETYVTDGQAASSGEGTTSDAADFRNYLQEVDMPQTTTSPADEMAYSPDDFRNYVNDNETQTTTTSPKVEVPVCTEPNRSIKYNIDTPRTTTRSDLSVRPATTTDPNEHPADRTKKTVPTDTSGPARTTTTTTTTTTPPVVSPNVRNMKLQDVLQLARKGDSLTWDDLLQNFYGYPMTYGRFTMDFPLEDRPTIILAARDTNENGAPLTLYLYNTWGKKSPDIRSDEFMQEAITNSVRPWWAGPENLPENRGYALTLANYAFSEVKAGNYHVNFEIFAYNCHTYISDNEMCELLLNKGIFHKLHIIDEHNVILPMNDSYEYNDGYLVTDGSVSYSVGDYVTVPDERYDQNRVYINDADGNVYFYSAGR